MSDDLTPAGAAAVRLAQSTVRLKAERDRARDIAVALEQRLARVEGLCAEIALAASTEKEDGAWLRYTCT